MVLNHTRKVALKRKRIEIEKRIATNELRQDKVWLPQDDFTNNVMQPMGKEQVPLNSYNTLKANANRLNNILFDSATMAKKIPFKATEHFTNLQQRKFQYDETLKEVQSF